MIFEKLLLNFKLRHKLNGAIAVTFILIAIIFTAIQIPFSNMRQKNTMNSINILLNTLVDRDQSPLANEIFEVQERAINIRINQMLNVEGVEGIAIYNSENELIVLNGLFEDYNPHDKTIIGFREFSTQQISIKGHSYLYYIRNISMVGESIGFIEIIYSLVNYDNEKRLFIILFTILLFLIFLLMVFFLNFFIIKTILSPLTFLRDGMNHISSGNLEHIINIKSNDEIGDLSEVFNQMSLKLSDSYQKTKFVEEYLKLLINAVSSVMIGIDNNQEVTLWNNAAVNMTGIKRKDAISKKVFSLIPYLEEYSLQLEEVLKTGSTITVLKEKINNEVFQIFNIHFHPLILDQIIGTVIRIEDISDMKRKEMEFRQSQKMDMLGSLAGGIAHDFNNILGGIVGTISLMKFKIKKGKKISPDKLESYIDTIEKSGINATNIVNQLLTLSRKQESKLIPVNLNESISNTVEICSNSFDKSISIETQLNNQNTMIMADPTQIEQVLLNLCVNAAHAMTIMRNKDVQWGGYLNLSISPIMADKHFISINPDAEKGLYWNLSIKDSGIGIRKEILDKIFDPFFSTKEKGKGTGLGLSMVYNIVHQHNGFINIYSEPGIGTTFNLYFPLLENISSQQKKQIDKNYLHGQGSILVIDDEEIMRKIARDILTECGYSVITAKNGKFGLEEYKKNKDTIKAVLLDMIMPELSGKETYKELKKINPNIKVLLCSGFRRDKRVEETIKMGIDGFIQKPYTLEKLATLIKKIL